MTGTSVPACSLLPREIIHIEPHHVTGWPRPVGHKLDVQVDHVRRECGRAAIDWRPPPYPGAQPGVTGTIVYDWLAPVLVIGRAS